MFARTKYLKYTHASANGQPHHRQGWRETRGLAVSLPWEQEGSADVTQHLSYLGKNKRSLKKNYPSSFICLPATAFSKAAPGCSYSQWKVKNSAQSPRPLLCQQSPNSPPHSNLWFHPFHFFHFFLQPLILSLFHSNVFSRHWPPFHAPRICTGGLSGCTSSSGLASSSTWCPVASSTCLHP